MILRLICLLVFLLLPFSFQNAFTAAAGFPSEVGQVIDLLVPKPDNPQLKRACMLQIEGSNVPCDTVWYVGFKDGAQSIQFCRYPLVPSLPRSSGHLSAALKSLLQSWKRPCLMQEGKMIGPRWRSMAGLRSRFSAGPLRHDDVRN